MGIQDLQIFLENSVCLEGGSVSVDLLKIAKNVSQRQQPHNTNRKIRPLMGNKLKLIIDAENCLDRLYGGYFSDWACGGQWNRMVQFLHLICNAMNRGNIEIAVVFNGTIEQCRMEEWKAQQANIRQRVGMVLKHINTKATPPPKIWWTAPICLQAALRMALRHLGITVMCTMDDHHQEVIAYCREYGFHGLLADDAEYAAFDPPRYFSSENLKLTYKGSIETKEYMLNVLTKNLGVTQEQLCIIAALLGNFLLPESDLQDLYKKINLTKKEDNNSENTVRVLATWVKDLPLPSDMDALILAVFGSLEDRRASRFRQSVQYYLNGTANGFLKYCAPAKPKQNKQQAKSASSTNPTTNTISTVKEVTLDESGFASETTEQQRETLQNYNLLTANIVIPSDFSDINLYNDESVAQSNVFNGIVNGTSTSMTSDSTTSLNTKTNSTTASSSTVLSNNSKKSASTSTKSCATNIATPNVSADVLRTASLRHQKGLMAPTILHVLSTQEVRLPCLLEDESNREFPPIYDVYLKLRQKVYAVLFNLHHLRFVHSKKKVNLDQTKAIPPPDIIVKEWVYSRSNPYQRPELVKAEPLPWAVPTLQRLWFGPSVDDKRRRMRAFLSCLNSDTPLILNTSYVPQHLLIMACVLRYIMSQDRAVMRRNELDAFICQAFNPNLMNIQYLQELTLSVVTSRGVQLAALFMKGVDMAILANDACGAPLPWLMCCPWLYFDGKLFHCTLARSSHAKNILEVCDNYIDRVVKVERMRKAILEGLDAKFAKILPQFPTGALLHPSTIPPPYIPATLPLAAAAAAAATARSSQALRGRSIAARGGQLQVAGVVVGSWGANYGFQGNMRQPQILPPGMVIPRGTNGRGGGGGGNGRGGYANNYNRNRQQQQQPQQQKNGQTGHKKNQANRKRHNNKSNKEKQSKGLALTVKTDNGDVPVSELMSQKNETPSSSSSSAAASSNNNSPTEITAPPSQPPPPLTDVGTKSNTNGTPNGTNDAGNRVDVVQQQQSLECEEQQSNSIEV